MRRSLVMVGFVVVSMLIGGAAGTAPLAAQQAGQEKPKEAAAAADPITGEWEGSVDTPNGPIAFTMKLKLEADKVSGEIGSAQGTSPATGTWADGKLSLSFTYASGDVISMSGTLKEGLLSGDLGLADMVMPWSAKKK